MFGMLYAVSVRMSSQNPIYINIYPNLAPYHAHVTPSKASRIHTSTNPNVNHRESLLSLLIKINPKLCMYIYT